MRARCFARAPVHACGHMCACVVDVGNVRDFDDISDEATVVVVFLMSAADATVMVDPAGVPVFADAHCNAMQYMCIGNAMQRSGNAI